jgi:dipeptidase D
MATETSILTGLEPRSFGGHFEALTRISRPSRHEEPVIDHVRAWADQQGFELQQDAGRNLVIRVPASPGREGAPTVVLQGHLDMVCERDPSSPNDPAEGRIALVRDGEWLTAARQARDRPLVPAPAPDRLDRYGHRRHRARRPLRVMDGDA